MEIKEKEIPDKRQVREGGEGKQEHLPWETKGNGIIRGSKQGQSGRTNNGTWERGERSWRVSN